MKARISLWFPRRVNEYWLCPHRYVDVLFVSAQRPTCPYASEKQRVDELVKSMTLDKDQHRGNYFPAFRRSSFAALKISGIEMSDGPVWRSGPNLNFRRQLMLPAFRCGLRDRSACGGSGAGIGRDERASRGVHFMLGPGREYLSSPVNGRELWNTFGEDPFLASAMASRLYQRHAGNGCQRDGQTTFSAITASSWRHDSDTILDERTAREILSSSLLKPR